MNVVARFYRKLQRRRVFGVVALYAVAAWAVIQVGDLAIDSGLVTGLTVRNLFVLALIGFPLALVAGWFYDITRKGIVRTAPAEADESFDASLRPRDYGLLVTLVSVWLGAYWYVHTPPAVEKSIAVMPFENRGNDPENVHFAFGIHDDLMTQLQRISNLKLIAAASVNLIDSDLPVRQAGLKLGAAFILRGTVERVLDRVRVNVVLIEADEEKQAWAGSYDRELTAQNLFSIRDDITREITGNLQTLLSPEEERRVFDLPTLSLEANNHYVRGRQLMATRDGENLLQAVKEFERAVEIDPEFALAWVGLADANGLLPGSSAKVDREDTFRAATEAIKKAMELNDQLGEAWATRGDHLRITGRLEEAESAYQKAIELAPNYAKAYHMYQWPMRQPEQYEKKLSLIYKAVQLDPMSIVYLGNLAGTLDRMGRSEEALQHAQQLVALHPESAISHRTIANIHRNAGRLADAVASGKRALEIDPDLRVQMMELALAYHDIGDMEGVAEVSERFRPAPGSDSPQSPRGLFLELSILSRQGRFDEALAFIDKLPDHAASLWLVPKTRGDIYLWNRDFERARETWAQITDTWFTPGAIRDGQIPDGDGCTAAGILMETNDEKLGGQVLKEIVQYHKVELPRYIQHVDRRRELGVCYLVMGEYDQALAYFERRIEAGQFSDWWLVRRLPWWQSAPDQDRLAEMDAAVEALLEEQRALLGEMIKGSEPFSGGDLG